MFKKLRNRIIIITMAVTTMVLVASGSFIMLFSTARPEPMPRLEPMVNFDNQELRDYIRNDRKEGETRLLITLLCVGGVVEVAVFMLSYYLSGKMVEPVKDSYEKQKLFIANASHELKTPLAVIQANVEAMEVDRQDQKWRDNIENEVTSANKLVLDLLQLARMDTSGVETEAAEEVDLKSVISERVEMFRPKFGGKINLKASGGVRTLTKQDFVQVLDILLDNATKYGKKKVSIILNNDGSLVVLNDGATIAENDLSRIFDRFYQTDKTREGSGLGLAIAKAVCERNGWKIRCESEKGVTKFIVEL